MARINKADFYYGSFLSYLISNGVKEPVMFDGAEKSKIINFGLKDKNYNVYLKYVTNLRKSRKGGYEFSNWDIVFSEKETITLFSDFEKEEYENIVVLICTNENLKDTCFAVLTYNQAISCLGNDAVNDQRRISVKHKKSSKNIACYGTGLSDEKPILRLLNFDEYFDFK